jgi:hypothetical protein
MPSSRDKKGNSRQVRGDERKVIISFNHILSYVQDVIFGVLP